MCGHTDSSQYVKKSEIKEVFMAGGTSRVPVMQRSMERLFGKPPKVLDPDASIALGAAVYSAFKASGEVLNTLQQKAVDDIDVSLIAPHFFGTTIRSPDGTGVINDTIIRKGAKLPCQESRQYGTVVDNQSGCDCKVNQSAIEEKNVEFVTTIWQGNLPLPPGLRRGSPVCVTFSYDLNGTMNVKFRNGMCDEPGGAEIEVDLRPGH
jgi:molecular chaperone DnaK